MPKILITPLSAIEDTIAKHRPSHMVTLLSPEHMIETPAGMGADRHLRLGVNDIIDVTGGTSPPAASHVLQLIEFGREWDAQFPMLIHCWAGISRSTAAAYTIACDRAGPGSEARLARLLRERAVHADPNRLIVKIADELLGRRGRMVEAVESIGRGEMVTEGRLFALPISVSDT